ncbi:fimbrial protein [Enterobacter sp. UNJFSC 003]|uniref:fimbrial protein n=1 Tax=Enterobacter sp. UNJFSC 003 TaxID=3122077 RepID=UPI002EA3423D|nr:fimbrial protein [Serratia liquefaciens]
MIKFLSIFPCVVFVTAAIAHDGTVTISGTIQDNTCEIAADSQSQTIKMGGVPVNMFHSTGDKGPPISFSIDLENCGPAASGANVTFSGTPDEQDKRYFSVQVNQNSAVGIAMGIYSGDSVLIEPGKASDSYPLESNAAASLNFFARYVSVKDEVSAGNANVILTFLLSYN